MMMSSNYLFVVSQNQWNCVHFNFILITTHKIMRAWYKKQMGKMRIRSKHITKMREWTLNGNSSADMDKSLPMNAATTEAISSVNQINDCISADPLETGLYNLRFYTPCDFPCFLHQYSPVTNLGKRKTPFLVLQK